MKRTEYAAALPIHSQPLLIMQLLLTGLQHTLPHTHTLRCLPFVWLGPALMGALLCQRFVAWKNRGKSDLTIEQKKPTFIVTS